MGGVAGRTRLRGKRWSKDLLVVLQEDFCARGRRGEEAFQLALMGLLGGNRGVGVELEMKEGRENTDKGKAIKVSAGSNFVLLFCC